MQESVGSSLRSDSIDLISPYPENPFLKLWYVGKRCGLRNSFIDISGLRLVARVSCLPGESSIALRGNLGSFNNAAPLVHGESQR